jgi:hypothetical protein
MVFFFSLSTPTLDKDFGSNLSLLVMHVVDRSPFLHFYYRDRSFDIGDFVVRFLTDRFEFGCLGVQVFTLAS